MRDQFVVKLGSMAAWVTSRRKRSPVRMAASSISVPPSAPVRLCSHASGLSASLTRGCPGSAAIASDPSAMQPHGSATPYHPWRLRRSAPAATALSKRALRARDAPSEARGQRRTRTAKARSIETIRAVRPPIDIRRTSRRWSSNALSSTPDGAGVCATLGGPARCVTGIVAHGLAGMFSSILFGG
jgi:hypothetical protein